MNRTIPLLCVLALFLCPSLSLGFEVALGPGWFLPYGDWKSGFSNGRMMEAGVSFPLMRNLSLGGRLRAASLTSSGGNASLDFFLPTADLTYRTHRLRGRFIPHVCLGAGLSRAVLEVGRGRETETDAFLTMGGGIAFEVNPHVSLGVNVSHLWFMAPQGGRGIAVIPALQIRL
jgi:opacity protein-like surface antigen